MTGSYPRDVPRSGGPWRCAPVPDGLGGGRRCRPRSRRKETSVSTRPPPSCSDPLRPVGLTSRPSRRLADAGPGSTGAPTHGTRVRTPRGYRCRGRAYGEVQTHAGTTMVRGPTRSRWFRVGVSGATESRRGRGVRDRVRPQVRGASLETVGQEGPKDGERHALSDPSSVVRFFPSAIPPFAGVTHTSPRDRTGG